MRITAELIGMLILLPATGYGVYCFIMRLLAKPRVIVVHDSRAPDNQARKEG